MMNDERAVKNEQLRSRRSSFIIHRSSFLLIFRSLLYHWRMHAAVAMGVAAATAVLTGALLVGDSMRGSLEDLTFERLGPVDEVILADRFFREKLAGELAASRGFPKESLAVPLIMLKGSVADADNDDARASGVNILGCNPAFWVELAEELPDVGDDKIVLNRPLAKRLDVDAGATVMLYLPGEGNIPGDSLLGTKHDTVQPTRMTVGQVIPADAGWVGRFDLRPSQQVPLNAYVPLELLQRRLKRPGRVNTILVASHRRRTEPEPGEHDLLAKLFRPTPADYGIVIERLDRGPLGYINITTDRMLFEPEVDRAVLRALKDDRFQQAFTYLANTIDLDLRDKPVTEQEDDGRIVPYSTITAVEISEKEPLGPFRTPSGRVVSRLAEKDGKPPPIVLNEWAARSLGIPEEQWPEPLPDEQPPAEPTDVYVSFFEPESTHGVARERTERFRLAAVVAMDGPAADRHFTPTVAGLSDKRSIEKWEVPFSPFHKGLIRRSDDTYYRQHGLTPKAFVSRATGERLWGSRFGQTTSFRVVPDGSTVETVTERIGEKLAMGLGQASGYRKPGFTLLPVKRQGIEASVGATPFNVLFLMFSSFIIAAAVMLVALLFRLGIERRAAELGLLLAVGFNRRQVGRLLAVEGLAVATAGSLSGTVFGIGYAWLMIVALQSWWIDAIVTPFLSLHVGPLSMVVGFFSGVVVSLGAILWAVRATRKVSGRRLLDGQASEQPALLAACPAWLPAVAVAMLVGAVAVGLISSRLGEDAQAGAFFGAGALVLGGCLLLVWSGLRGGATGPAVAVGRGNLLRMALRNAARNPGRSTLSAGLVAATCFLIVATSAFRLDPSADTPSLHSGNGGFALVAETDQPVFQNLNTPDGRERLGFLGEESDALGGATTVAFRMRSGDDASCLNLYQPREPRVLGVPVALIDRGGFAWDGSAAETSEQKANPWRLLQGDLGKTPDGRRIVPVVIEKNTALYALHLWQGVGAIYELPDGRGGTIPVQIVGLLANGIFQGDLLVSEDAFLECFPDADGFRFFLVENPPEETAGVKKALEKAMAGYGLVAETTGDRLARFLAVQNTYLLTFLSLGGLGLLLGTFGLAAVQMRNVLERRRELALLRAAGFRRAMLSWLVTLENALLLVLGLGVGLLAALVAVLPHLFDGRAMIPWLWVAATLGTVLVVGLLAGLLAVRATLQAPLLGALRGE